MRPTFIGIAALASVLAGCAQDDYRRTEGLTLTAGDAIAVNSALQVIDPWPEGVEDTNLDTPASRDDDTAAKPAVSAPSTTGTSP